MTPSLPRYICRDIQIIAILVTFSVPSNLPRYICSDTGSETVVRVVIAGVVRQVQILVLEKGNPLVMVVVGIFWLAFQKHAG